MDTGNILPQSDDDKFRQFLASIKSAEPADPSSASVAGTKSGDVPGAPHVIDRLVAGGYLPFLRPCAPPGVPRMRRDKVTGALVESISDGKAPSSFRDGRWGGMKGWPTFVPAPEDVEQWRRWPNPNWCLVSGEIGVFDIDVKVSPTDAGPAADRARRLVEATKAAIGQDLGLPPGELPLRWRDNSTSCAIIVRLAEPCGKRVLRFIGPEGEDHAIEFLGRGQQVVVAGRHASGAEIHNSLLDTAFKDLPAITPDKLNEIIAAISTAALSIGYTHKSSLAKPGRDDKPPYSPYVAVLRAIMSRRAEWVSDVIPVVPGDHAEWRVSSVELDRDLEEDLSVYLNGIYDHATRRDHTPASLIVEFGAIDAGGEITFGGAPIYEPDGAEQFAVVGEADRSVRRPTEAQALTWLCRRLAGDHVTAFLEGATWATSLPGIARAVGLQWEALEAVRWFQFPEGDEPETWRPDRLTKNADTLVVLRAVDPGRFARVEAAKQPEAVDLQKIADERQATVAALPPPAEASASGSISWIDPTAWAGKPIRKREWEVEGWIPRNEVTLLYGDGGVGKTLLIHQYATCAATGKPFLAQETRPARVMAFFCEDSEDELHRRQADINGMLHVDYADLGNLRISTRKHDDNALGVWDKTTGTTKLTPAWHRLRADAVAWGADVVIVDTLSDVYVGDEIARAQVNSFVKTCLGRLASEIGGSVIALGHPSVSGKTSGTGTSGSTQWSNAVRSRLYLRYPDKTERGKIRELETMKLNYGAKGSVLKIKWDRGAFDVVAGMSTADRPAGFPASDIPDIADAVEAAVAAAINECSGVALSPGKTSPYYGPKVLKLRSPDLLQAFNAVEIEAAFARMERNGTIRHQEIGRDGSRRAIKGYVLVPDKLSAGRPEPSNSFD